MKRRISLMLALIMLSGFTGAMPEAAAASINIGDYVIFGKYYDEPILWRCVDIENGDPLMLSDKIISIKPFDAAGSHPNDYADYGAFGDYRIKYGLTFGRTPTCVPGSTQPCRRAMWTGCAAIRPRSISI